MHIKSLYIPMDRRQAMAFGGSVPEETTGAALFADISGFTPLTEALARVLGPRHGAEELTHHLNKVYDVLIAESSRYGGSVIGFSGDAITCWYADDPQHPIPASQRAVAAAIAMQREMKQFAEIKLPDGSFATLEMKAAVASGPARRFLVGDPSIQLIDTLVGATVVRMAEAEHLANRGDVVVDKQTATALGERAVIKEWRNDPHTNDPFAVITDLTVTVDPCPWPEIADGKLDDAQISAWVLGAINKRLAAGEAETLTELRPAVALFLRFMGIDYDGDPDAGKKLNGYVQWVQKTLARYDGTLIQLTIGDKGSYLYAAFGAPVAHEDDPRRAVNAALDLRTVPADLDFINHIHIGLSQGLMRTGTYGSTTRHTYGVLGDEVNLAARLMQHAAAGEVLVSRRVQKNVTGPFVWEQMPSIRVKGKTEPVPLLRVTGKGKTAASGYSGAMVGRDTEVQTLRTFIEPIFNGHFAGIAVVYGEAGMGKSRLIYELRSRLQSEKNVSWYFCPAEQLVHQSLFPFRHLLRDYFNYDPEITDEDNKERFDEVFDALISDMKISGHEELAHDLEDERSFLGALIELHWTGSLYDLLEPQLRHESMLLAFRALIEAESLRQPIVLQIEDAHWLDADSQEMIKLLTSNTETYPVAVLVTSRYRDDGSHVELDRDPDITPLVVDLNRLTSDGIRQLAAQVLSRDNEKQNDQQYTVSDVLATLLADKTNGNPFFLEQLTLDLKERNLLQQNGSVFTIEKAKALEIPASINAVLIARLDRLMSDVKAVVQTASVLGQEFDTDVLLRMFQTDDHLSSKVKLAEAQAIWQGQNEIRYFFRHALLRDAAYDMQLRARLRQLHKLAGGAIETVHAHDLAAHYVDLVYHYRKAEDAQLEQRYAKLAAEHAANDSANVEAVEFFSRALELTPESELNERYEMLLAREHIYDLQGNRARQREDVEALTAIANQLNDHKKQTQADLRRVHYAEVTNDFDTVIQSAQHIIALAVEDKKPRAEASGYLWWGRALIGQAQYKAARQKLEKALEIAVAGDFGDLEADTFRELGIVDTEIGDYDLARDHFQKAINFYHSMGYKRGECKTLNNLGLVALHQGNYAKANAFFDDALCLCHQIGYRYAESRVLTNLGLVALDEGDTTRAKEYFEKSLHLSHEIGDRLKESIALGNLGLVALHQGDYTTARSYQEKAIALSHELGTGRSSESLSNLSLLLHHLGDHQDALKAAQDAVKAAQDTHTRPLEAQALVCVGHALAGLKRHQEAIAAYNQAVAIRRELGQSALAIDGLTGLTEVELEIGEKSQALHFVEEILHHLEQGNLNSTEEPFRVFLVCYNALKASNDSRARTVLETANKELKQRAATLQDESLRRSYLENVPSHREIAKLAVEV